jgi:hypothetical protein
MGWKKSQQRKGVKRKGNKRKEIGGGGGELGGRGKGFESGSESHMSTLVSSNSCTRKGIKNDEQKYVMWVGNVFFGVI